MKHPLLVRAAAAALLAAAPFANAQFYQVDKARTFYQTSAAGAKADPNAGASFSFSSPVASTLTTPNQTTVTPTAAGNLFQTTLSFPTQAALDASYPDGNYVIHVPGLGPVTLPLSGSIYPADPGITPGGPGTWLPGGVLLLDPTVSNTLNLASFPGYATAGVAGATEIGFYDMSGNEASALVELIATQSLFFGGQVLAAPVSTFTIPKDHMTGGHLYELVISYLTLTDVDNTSITAQGVFGYYLKTTTVFVMAQTGTTAETPAPTLLAQPANQVAAPDASVTFEVSGNFPTGGAPGAGANWYFIDSNGNGPALPAKDAQINTATSAQLIISPVAASDAGSYYVFAVSPGGVLESQVATLTVLTTPPVLTVQPAGQTMNSGSTLVLTAGASGATSYEWFLNGNRISDSALGATSNIISDSAGPQLVISKITGLSNGSYTVVAVNSNGSSPASSAAAVSVVTATNPGTVGSISARAFVGTNDNILIGGFFIAGTTSRSVLIQAIGPGLIPPPYNVASPLAKPALSVHQSQNGADVVLYSNTGWGSNPVLLTSASKLSALPVLQPGSADSELLLTLPPGGYTAEVASADNVSTGVALCAIYQLP
jgi:hypothetical protein